MADITNAYAHWNQREDENIACWTCEHFQRYDADGSENWCEGECRKAAPENQFFDYNSINVNWFLSDTYFPYVPWGNISWCSGYQVSREANLPAPPPGKDDCANQTRDEWVQPPEINAGGVQAPIPNKKGVENSCWYCVHFQRQGEVPSTTDPDYCKGYCRIEPPKTYYTQTHDWVGPRISYDPSWPYIVQGPIIWCSRWERTKQEVPPPPEQGGELCGSNPV